MIGSLHVLYLGLPLTTRSMTTADYAPLIDSIRNRLRSWSSRHLSFAGHLQLIKYVVSSIANFWCLVFRLPKRCVSLIGSMCNGFLWSGSPNSHTKAKVSWEEVCSPKSEGGLGIHNLSTTSQVFAFHLIWRLLTSMCSLWVNWIHRYLLRRHTFWNVPITLQGSWIWRKLLKLRDSVREFVRGDIHDGRSLSFWFDSWTSHGPLIMKTWESGPRISGVPISASVRDAIFNSTWHFRHRLGHLTSLFNDIKSITPPRDSNGPDGYFWRHSDGVFKPTFSSSSTREQLRIRKAIIPWARLVWFSLSIPRCSFIAWLAFRNRLSTGDRMAHWGLSQNCVFCGERNETRDHLFFACPYTFTVWIDVSRPLMRRYCTPDWDDTVRYLLTRRFSREVTQLLCLAFQVTIERLWRERNNRRHNISFHTETQTYKVIDRTVRNRLLSVAYFDNSRKQHLMETWLRGR